MVQASTTVEVGVDGAPVIDVTVENTGPQQNDLYIGASIRRPDGSVVNLRPKEVELASGAQTVISFTQTGTGNLSPETGGPAPVDNTFAQVGAYDVITQVWNRWDKNADPNQNSFGIALMEPLTSRIIVEEAIQTTEEPAPSPGPGPGEPQPPSDTPLIPDIPEEVAGIEIPPGLRDGFNQLGDAGRVVAAAAPIVAIGAVSAPEEAERVIRRVGDNQ